MQSHISERRLRMLVDKTRNWNSKQTVILIADSSGSVQHCFDSEKRLIETLVAQYPVQQSDDNEFCLIQFSNTAEVVCQPTTDVQKLIQAVHNMKHLNGNTNLYPALEKALEVIRTGSRLRSHVWVVTDGEYNGQDPFPAIMALRLEKALVTAIGVGRIRQDGLDSVASPGRVFLARNFDDAIDLVQSGRTHVEEIKLRVNLMKTRNRLGEPAPFKVKIVNHTRSCITESSKLVVAANSRYWEKLLISIGADIPIDDQHDVKFDLQVLPEIETAGFEKALDAFEEIVSISLLTTPNSTPDSRVVEEAFVIQLDNFTQQLYELTPMLRVPSQYYIPQPSIFNICIMGRPGTGKSSFIGTLATSLSACPQQDVLLASRGARSTEHFTALSKVYQFGPLQQIAEFFDTPGYEGSSDASESTDYRGVDLYLALAGYLPDNVKLVKPGLNGGVFRLVNIPKEQRLSAEQAWPRAIHCGILFIHAAGVGLDELLYEKNLAAEWTRTHNRVLIVVISNIDQRSTEEYPDLIKEVSKTLAIDDKFIYLLKNYCALGKTKLEKDFAIDKMSLQILHAALAGAQTFLDRWPSTIDQIVKAGTEELHHLVLLGQPSPPKPSSPTPSESVSHYKLQSTAPVLDPTSQMLRVIRKLVKAATPDEARITKHERDFIEEVIIDYRDSKDAIRLLRAFKLFYNNDGSPLHDDDEEEALKSFGRSLRRLFNKQRQSSVALEASAPSTSTFDGTCNNTGGELQPALSGGSVFDGTVTGTDDFENVDGQSLF
ncbi:hypothetical protein SeLEV6574_g07797 [Synchytrium endobioticum]|nr:hypothetical protein SeLEV6574_g07797 [Synchytrium endobioticum]